MGRKLIKHKPKKENVARIPLINSSQTALVDLEDESFVKQFQWFLGSDGQAWTLINGEAVEMGSLIMGRMQERHFNN